MNKPFAQLELYCQLAFKIIKILIIFFVAKNKKQEKENKTAMTRYIMKLL